MNKFYLRKTRELLLVVLFSTFITFSLTYISAGDAAERILTANDNVVSEELIQKTREEMGLDDPLLVQYVRWLKSFIKGDLGQSYRFKEPVFDLLLARASVSIGLATMSLIILFFLSMLFGVLSAFYKNRMPDYIIRFFSILSISLPNFWLGLIIINIFVVRLGLFKIIGDGKITSLILPALALAIPLIGRYTRQIRIAILEQLSGNYVIGARARGMKEIDIIFKEVVPNSLNGIIPIFGLSIASLLGGTVIIENVFLLPGLGTMALQAIEFRDYPLLQGYVVFMSIIYIAISFIVDILTRHVDPKMKIIEEGEKI